MIRVLLVDDQAVVRGGLKLILEAQDDIEVIGEAADGSEAVTLARALDPDVVLMDIRMPVLDGIEATRQLAAHGTDARVLVLTTYGLDEYVYEALQAGAAGFLLKTDPPKRLVEAVRVVAGGEALLAPDITRRLIDHYLGSRPSSAPPPHALGELTAREREVLEHLSRGLSNAEIAQTLSITEGTTKTHVARILAKLDLRDRVQAVIYAYENGLVQAGARDAHDPGV
jgi:DNA-binding NarL/FixJ family response regulator